MYDLSHLWTCIHVKYFSNSFNNVTKQRRIKFLFRLTIEMIFHFQNLHSFRRSKPLQHEKIQSNLFEYLIQCPKPSSSGLSMNNGHCSSISQYSIANEFTLLCTGFGRSELVNTGSVELIKACAVLILQRNCKSTEINLCK